MWLEARNVKRRENNCGVTNTVLFGASFHYMDSYGIAKAISSVAIHK